jgi:hypothetical protein
MVAFGFSPFCFVILTVVDVDVLLIISYVEHFQRRVLLRPLIFSFLKNWSSFIALIANKRLMRPSLKFSQTVNSIAFKLIKNV